MERFSQETVRENMSWPARTVAPEMTLGDLFRLLSSNDFHACPVVRERKLVGVVSRGDSIKPFHKARGANAVDFDAVMGTTVEEIMSLPVATVEPDATLEQAIDLMTDHDVESLPVVDHDGRVKGVIAREDVVRALARSTWRSSQPLPLAPMGYAIA